MRPLILLAVLLFVTGVLLGVDFVFYLVYVTAALLLFSRWHVPRALRRMRVQRFFAPNAFWGESIPVELEIENPLRLPVAWVELHESTPLQLQVGPPVRRVLTLPGRQKARLTYAVKAQRRGYYRLGPLAVRVGDLFGFAEADGRVQAAYVTVYPRLHPIGRLRLPSRLPLGVLPSRQPLYADPSRPIGARPFRPGDSLRRINWKATARLSATAGDALMVRIDEPAVSVEALIVLNLAEGDYPRRERERVVEWAIEAAAALAAHLIERRQAVGLATNGLDPLRGAGRVFDEESGRLLINPADAVGRADYPRLPVRGGRAHLMQVLGVLARVEAQPTPPFVGWLPTAVHGLGWGATVIAITPTADPGLPGALHQLVRAGFNPLLLFTAPQHDLGAWQRRARQLGFHVCAALQPADLELRL